MKMVRIVSSCTVFPKTLTPQEVVPLSLCDHLQPWTLAPVIFVYTNSCNNTLEFETLKQSLSSTLVPFYPFAGRLYINEDGVHHLDCNAKGAQLLEAETDETLEDFGDFGPTTHKLNDLVFRPDYTRPIHELPVLVVQFTRFKCGGFTLGVASSHAIADGIGSLHFINSWARTARGEKIDVLPYLDRTQLSQKSFISYTGPTHYHEELEPLPLLVGANDSNAERMKETTPAMLKITKSQVEQLKNKANDDFVVGKDTKQRPYSRFEALTAHIWKSLSKARGSVKDQPTKLRFSLDIRKKIKPPLLEGYLGNAILMPVTIKCSLNDILTRPLSYVAGKIREATDKFSDEYIKSYLHALANLGHDICKMRGSFHIPGSNLGMFFGNPNLSVTSWINLPLNEADFGCGKPIYTGPVVINLDGKCFILPGPEGDGSVFVAIRVQTAHVDAFKTYFYEGMAA